MGGAYTNDGWQVKVFFPCEGGTLAQTLDDQSAISNTFRWR
jgi:hypothetical protein